MPIPQGDWYTGYNTIAGRDVTSGTFYPDQVGRGGAPTPGVNRPFFATMKKAKSLFANRKMHAIIRSIWVEPVSNRSQLDIANFSTGGIIYWSHKPSDSPGVPAFWAGSMHVDGGFRLEVIGDITFSIQYETYLEGT